MLRCLPLWLVLLHSTNQYSTSLAYVQQTETPIEDRSCKALAPTWSFSGVVGREDAWNWNPFTAPTLGGTGNYFVDESRNAFMKVVTRFLEYDVVSREAFLLHVLYANGIEWSPRLLWTNNKDKIVTTWMGISLMDAPILPTNLEQQVSRILTDLARVGVEHNDIKPGELLLRDNTVHLVDFGWGSCGGDFSCGAGLSLSSSPKPQFRFFDSDALRRTQGYAELARFQAWRRMRQMNASSSSGYYLDPNRSTGSQRERPAVSFDRRIATVSGYRRFFVDWVRKNVSLSSKLIMVLKSLKEFMESRRNVSVTDIGASTGQLGTGFISQYSHSVNSVTLLEHDMDAIEVFLRVKAWGVGNGWLELERIHPRHGQLTTPNVGPHSVPKSEIVTALAVIHWLYSATAHFGSLDSVVEALITFVSPGGLLAVEWVDPKDGAIRYFGHLKLNAYVHRSPYNREAFESALEKHCARYLEIGATVLTGTRRLFHCYVPSR